MLPRRGAHAVLVLSLVPDLALVVDLSLVSRGRRPRALTAGVELGHVFTVHLRRRTVAAAGTPAASRRTRGTVASGIDMWDRVTAWEDATYLHVSRQRVEAIWRNAAYGFPQPRSRHAGGIAPRSRPGRTTCGGGPATGAYVAEFFDALRRRLFHVDRALDLVHDVACMGCELNPQPSDAVPRPALPWDPSS